MVREFVFYMDRIVVFRGVIVGFLFDFVKLYHCGICICDSDNIIIVLVSELYSNGEKG